MSSMLSLPRHDLLAPVALAPASAISSQLEAGLVGVVVAEHAVEHRPRRRTSRRRTSPRGMLPRRGLVADLHVVDAGLDAGVVDGADQLVGELMIVDQPAVADRAIEHFQFGAVGDPGSGFRHAILGEMGKTSVGSCSRRLEKIAHSRAARPGPKTTGAAVRGGADHAFRRAAGTRHREFSAGCLPRAKLLLSKVRFRRAEGGPAQAALLDFRCVFFMIRNPAALFSIPMKHLSIGSTVPFARFGILLAVVLASSFVAESTSAKLIGELVDVSQEFQDRDSTYFVAGPITKFDAKTGDGELAVAALCPPAQPVVQQTRHAIRPRQLDGIPRHAVRPRSASCRLRFRSSTSGPCGCDSRRGPRRSASASR